MTRERLLILTLLLTFVISGCRQEQATTPPASATPLQETSQGNGDGNVGPTAAIATATPTDALAALDPSGQTLALFHSFDGEIGDALTTLVADFNAANEQGISIELFSADQAADAAPFVDQITAAAPQLILAPALPPTLANAAVDLSQYAASPTWGNGGPSAGPMLSVPLAVATEALYYNVDLVAELGIDGPPTSWEELMELACEAGENQYGFAYPYQLNAGEPSHAAAFVAAQGGTLADDDNLTLESEAASATFGTLQGLYRDGCMAPVVERQLLIDNFGAGNMLFVADSSTQQSAYGDAVAAGYGGEWAIAPLPLTAGGRLVTSGVTGAVLADSAEQQLASWLFINWLQAPAQRQSLSAATGLIAPDANGDELAAALAGETQPDPTAPFSDDVRAIIEEATAQIVDQNADLEMTLTDATSELKNWIGAHP